jgi:hypothetical protein
MSTWEEEMKKEWTLPKIILLFLLVPFFIGSIILFSKIFH